MQGLISYLKGEAGMRKAIIKNQADKGIFGL
jgi:hypothetical protein